MNESLAFLAHREEDSVAVAVRDVDPGSGSVAFLDAERRSEVKALEPIPLGHKVALVAIPTGSKVIEYGETVGIAKQDINVGEMVHAHNIRSDRWQIKA